MVSTFAPTSSVLMPLSAGAEKLLVEKYEVLFTSGVSMYRLVSLLHSTKAWVPIVVTVLEIDLS